MVKEVHILLAYFLEVVLSLDAHGRYLNPLAVFPVAARSGNLAEIDFRVKVGGKRITVVAAVTVKDIDGVDLVEFML